jgi:ketosteroid isomerase-like protein
MATDQVALVQSLYDAFARCQPAAVVAALDAEVRWETPALPWSRGSYSGRDGVSEYFASFAVHLDEARVEPDDLIAAQDRVVALGYEQARVRATGRRFRARFVHVWTLRADKVVSMRGLVDSAEVMRAFGA